LPYSEYENCRLCPRNCGAKRNSGQKGFCRESSELRVGRASLHMWEEPCISGENGSGTVFFSGCSLSCVYCQNYNLSRGKEGVVINAERLAEIFVELQKKGAHNVNLVTGEHFTPHICDAIKIAKQNGLEIPVVFNCGGYTSKTVLEKLEGLVDIYLSDFKYFSSDISKKYSGAEDYFSVALVSAKEMVRQQPKPEFNESGIMQKGVIFRHLCLPGCSEDSKNVIRYLYENFSKNVYLSIMNQYTPDLSKKLPSELGRKLSKREYEDIIDYCICLGIENAYVQEDGTAEESFIPEFDGFGVL